MKKRILTEDDLITINKDIEDKSQEVVNKSIISDNNDTGTRSVETNAIIASDDSRARGGSAGVFGSRDCSTNTTASAVLGSWKSKINDTDPRYIRNMVMLASNEFTFDPKSANDNKVVGGYKDSLSWMLDSRNGEIYARDEIKIGNTKVKQEINNKLNKNSIKVSRNNYIYSSGWSRSGQYYRARVSNSNVTSGSIVDVNIHLDYLEEATDLLPVTESFSGYFYLYAENKPSSTIKFDYKIIKEG